MADNDPNRSDQEGENNENDVIEMKDGVFFVNGVNIRQAFSIREIRKSRPSNGSIELSLDFCLNLWVHNH